MDFPKFNITRTNTGQSGDDTHISNHKSDKNQVMTCFTRLNLHIKHKELDSRPVSQSIHYVDRQMWILPDGWTISRWGYSFKVWLLSLEEMDHPVRSTADQETELSFLVGIACGQTFSWNLWVLFLKLMADNAKQSDIAHVARSMPHICVVVGSWFGI